MEAIITVQIRTDTHYNWRPVAEKEIIIRAPQLDYLPWSLICADIVEEAIREAEAKQEEEFKAEMADNDTV